MHAKITRTYENHWFLHMLEALVHAKIAKTYENHWFLHSLEALVHASVGPKLSSPLKAPGAASGLGRHGLGYSINIEYHRMADHGIDIHRIHIYIYHKGWHINASQQPHIA